MKLFYYSVWLISVPTGDSLGFSDRGTKAKTSHTVMS